MDFVTCEKGEYIIEEGDKGEVLYIIESGEMSCHKVINDESKYLKDYLPGDVFGELSLLYNVPRAASIKAELKSTLWSLDRSTFIHIVIET